jgi:hypothetical protein
MGEDVPEAGGRVSCGLAMASNVTVGRSSPLDVLLHDRYGGAVNIRDIRFQILYSVLRACELFANGNTTGVIRLEGIEDLDLLGLAAGDEYIQVKAAVSPWNWAKLKEPVESFLEAHRSESTVPLRLVVNFPLIKDIQRLSAYEQLPTQEKKIIKRKFVEMCKSVYSKEKLAKGKRNATTQEANDLFDRLSISSISDKVLADLLADTVSSEFNVGRDTADIYIQVLAARFLEIAEKRGTITAADFESIRLSTEEVLSREQAFLQGFGRGLIDKLVWTVDASPDDFFDAKATRSGHVVAGLVIQRPKWLGEIHAALTASRVCVVRSSSGQGKSALLFSYAYEHWGRDNVLVLRVAETPEQVELVTGYLRRRASLNVPLLLLVDNAGWRLPLWSLVAQECAALGIRVLATARNEDWYRFFRRSLANYEVVEPVLNLEEARQIFHLLQAQGRTASYRGTPEEAYERIGEPHLLIEYTYLITHGVMLEERLEDQMAAFAEHGEDPAKVEILRRVSVADAFGVPVSSESILDSIGLRDDPQRILQSLENEYLRTSDGQLTGLHWVRSGHLVQILHRNFRNVAVTALEIIDSIATADIPTFVGNALTFPDLDTGAFMQGLVERAASSELDRVLAFLDGLYLAGERQCAELNRPLFDEAFDLLGPSGVTLLSFAFTPTVKIDTLEQFPDNDNIAKLRQLADGMRAGKRGLSICHDFLEGLIPSLDGARLAQNKGETGRLLDWMFLSGVVLPNWTDIRDTLMEPDTLLALDRDSLCALLQGVGRYNPDYARVWLNNNLGDVIGCLKLHLDCMQLRLTNEVVDAAFIPQNDTKATLHEQKLERLHLLRSAFPLAERYICHAIWPAFLGAGPSVDESVADVPAEKLPFQSDVTKNSIWIGVVDGMYRPPSFYQYQKFWAELREGALAFAEGLSRWMRRLVTGHDARLGSYIEAELLVDLVHRFQHVIGPPMQTSNDLRDQLKAVEQNWAPSYRNFLQQISSFIQDPGNRDMGKPATSNFLNACLHLDELHAAFGSLFSVTSDYFNAGRLNVQENKSYSSLADLIDLWIIDPPLVPIDDPLTFIAERRIDRRRADLQKIQETLRPVRDAGGLDFAIADDFHMDGRLRSLALAVNVADPLDAIAEVRAIIDALLPVREEVHVFYVVPLFQGARYLEGTYYICSLELHTMAEEGEIKHWETLVPRPVSEEVLAQLPQFPHAQIPHVRLTQVMLGLINDLEWIRKVRVMTEELEQSPSAFERQLAANKEAMLQEQSHALVDLAKEGRELLHSSFAASSDDVSYKQIDDFLSELQTVLRGASRPDTLMESGFSREALGTSLSRMLERDEQTEEQS